MTLTPSPRFLSWRVFRFYSSFIMVLLRYFKFVVKILRRPCDRFPRRSPGSWTPPQPVLAGGAVRLGVAEIMKIEALCAAPPESLTHSPSQMPLSCPVAPQVARRPLRLRPRGHAPRNTSLRRRTNYLEPQRLRPLRHAPNTFPGCRSCTSAPSPAAPAGVREEHYS